MLVVFEDPFFVVTQVGPGQLEILLKREGFKMIRVSPKDDDIQVTAPGLQMIPTITQGGELATVVK